MFASLNYRKAMNGEPSRLILLKHAATT